MPESFLHEILLRKQQFVSKTIQDEASYIKIKIVVKMTLYFFNTSNNTVQLVFHLILV